MKRIKLKYPAIFEVDNDGICISFPDVPEANSCAYSKKQAVFMSKEVLKLALHGLKIEDIPKQVYPIKRFTSKEIFIKTIAIKLELRDNKLYDKNVVETENT